MWQKIRNGIKFSVVLALLILVGLIGLACAILGVGMLSGVIAFIAIKTLSILGA